MCRSFGLVRRALSIAVAVAALAACAPTRDNPFDPASAPHASALAIDATAPEGGCLASVADAETRGPTDQILRTRCLLLDATASKSADGAALASSAEFEFAILSTSGDSVLQPFSTSATAFLPAAVLGGLTPGPTQFRVRVRDRGHVGEAATTVTVLNAAPLASVNPSRVIRAYGPFWLSPGASTVALPFHATAVDPEGHALVSECWSFSNADVPAACGADVVANAKLGSESRVVATFAAVDEAGTTTLAQSIVELSAAPYFRVPIEPLPGVHPRAVRRAGVRSSEAPMIGGALGSSANGSAFVPAAAGAITSGVAVAGIFSQPVVEFQPFPKGATVTTDSGFVLDLLAADPLQPAAWGWSNFDHRLSRWDLSNQAPHESESLALDPALPAGAIPRLAVTDDGSAWLLAAPTTLVHARAGGAVETATLAENVVAIDVRPGTDELWLLSTDGSSWTLSRATGADGIASLAPVYSSTGGASAMRFATADDLWLALSGASLLRLDEVGLERLAPLEIATELSITGLPSIDELFADPVTRGVFALGDPNAHIDFDGTVATANTSTPLEGVSFVDPFGDLWFDGSQGASVGFLARSMPTTGDDAAAFTTVSHLSEDVDDVGQFWVVDSELPVVTRYDSEGHTAGSIPLPGDVQRGSVHVSADGRYVWVELGEAIEVFRMDPGGAVDLGAALPTGAANVFEYGSMTYGGNAFIPSSPVGDPFAFAVSFTTSAQVLVLGTTGAPTVATVFPPSETYGNAYFDSHGAIFPRSDRLCLATVSDPQPGVVAPVLHVQSISRAGAVVPSATVIPLKAQDGIARLFPVATGADATGEACWVGVSNATDPLASTPWTVYVFDSSLSLVRSFSTSSFPGRLNSLVALSTTRARATVVVADAAGVPVTDELEIDVAAGTEKLLAESTSTGHYLLRSAFSSPSPVLGAP